MRYFAAIPLALLCTPVTVAFDVPPARMEQGVESADVFRDFMSGLEHFNGWGDSTQDYLEAMKYFKRAARGGHNQAQHYLGLMYYKGLGVEKDNIEAYMWFDLAAASGDKVGVVLKITLKDLLSAEDLGKAERRKQTWLKAPSAK